MFCKKVRCHRYSFHIFLHFCAALSAAVQPAASCCKIHIRAASGFLLRNPYPYRFCQDGIIAMYHACTMHVSYTAYLSNADAFQTDHHRLATDHPKLPLCCSDSQEYNSKQHPRQPSVLPAFTIPADCHPPASFVTLPEAHRSSPSRNPYPWLPQPYPVSPHFHSRKMSSARRSHRLTLH